MLNFPDIVSGNHVIIGEVNAAKLPLCSNCGCVRTKGAGNGGWKVIKTEEQYAMCRIAAHDLWLPYDNKIWLRLKDFSVPKWEWGKGGKLNG